MKPYTLFYLAVCISTAAACANLLTCFSCISENCKFVVFSNGSRQCKLSEPVSDAIISVATTARHCGFVQRLSKSKISLLYSNVCTYFCDYVVIMCLFFSHHKKANGNKSKECNCSAWRTVTWATQEDRTKWADSSTNGSC